MRTAILFALASTVIPVFGQTAGIEPRQSYSGTISGEALLSDYMGPARPRDDPFLKGGDIVNREMARGYMNGIKDATEGKAWCYVSGKPHELNEDIAQALMKLEPEERKAPAATLVVNALSQRFPCPTDRRTP